MPYLFNNSTVNLPERGYWRTPQNAGVLEPEDGESHESKWDGPVWKGTPYSAKAGGYATVQTPDGAGKLLEVSEEDARSITSTFPYLQKRAYVDSVICPYTSEELKGDEAEDILTKRKEEYQTKNLMQKAIEVEKIKQLTDNVGKVVDDLRTKNATKLEEATPAATEPEKPKKLNPFFEFKKLHPTLSPQELTKLYNEEKAKKEQLSVL